MGFTKKIPNVLFEFKITDNAVWETMNVFYFNLCHK